MALKPVQGKGSIVNQGPTINANTFRMFGVLPSDSNDPVTQATPTITFDDLSHLCNEDGEFHQLHQN